MPVFRLIAPGQPAELVNAESLRHEGSTIALMGTAFVMNRPREIVVRRVAATVQIEVAEEPPAVARD